MGEENAVIRTTVNEIDVVVPNSAADPITLASSTGNYLAVTLPEPEASQTAEILEPGVVAFDAGSFTTIPVVKDDGSVQIATVINGSESPIDYGYEILAAGAGSLVATADGAILALNPDGSFAGAVAPAWARDADGRDVQTHYEVSGNTLTQIVDHAGGEFSYPIVADPWLGSNLFSRLGKGSDGGKPRHLLYRSTWGAVVSGYATASPIFLSAGWDEAYSRWAILRGKPTIHQQYDCHAIYAVLKPDSWNLEEKRSSKPNWAASVASHLCNW
ncbi:hypothetical protein [Microbacterium sp. PMB16]|uniref:hypothetical protein n=1 Tax=Microbacterium sp. PMB16 TaxID=3120157 RepID=UPI003F4B6D66